MLVFLWIDLLKKLFKQYSYFVMNLYCNILIIYWYLRNSYFYTDFFKNCFIKDGECIESLIGSIAGINGIISDKSHPYKISLDKYTSYLNSIFANKKIYTVIVYYVVIFCNCFVFIFYCFSLGLSHTGPWVCRYCH